ncbi:MFS transporter [Streptomyces litchfieldiae]|uniref:MFS transporter n=1 Tax=Streptomyces litchfieldiae TaxID=3075543 RepID=A0ABU2MMX9_9ACTN|nr:MFS transporter [Streptomyces sp. DSM 44938]MDT0342293.1 MFS transporter [Streptomyces sp. DSM 44938]
MTGYRQVLAVPGMASLLGVSLLARTAITADVMALTMYVVLGLDMSYAAAGGVAAAITTGLALGGPLLGRVIDSRGLRTVLLVTAVTQVVFWLSVPVLPYGVLLGAAFAAGLLMVPAQPVTRQAIAAMTTAGQRRAAFALESVHGELSYMAGPAVVILCAAKMSPDVVVWAVGAAIVAGGAGIALLNPPLRAEDEADSGAAGRPPRREWLGAGMIAVLTMAFGATTLLGGIDLAIVATLEEAGQVSWAAMVVTVFGVASVAGGLIYGALSRSLPTWLLLGLLGLVTIPAGLARDWPWLCVAVVGTGLLTAPTLSTVADAVSRLAPAGVRGEATGLQSSAQSAGFALGSTIVGVAIDVSVPAGGFAVAGLAGLAAALTGYLLSRRPTARTRSPLGDPGIAGAPDAEPLGADARPGAWATGPGPRRSGDEPRTTAGGQPRGS